MFLNDDDFDEPEIDVPISRFAQIGKGPRSDNLGGGNSSSSSSSSSSNNRGGNSKDQDLEDEGDFGTAGSMSQNASSSRARMLAQQREVLMKRRQDALEAGGMVRSSTESNSPLRKSADNQFTPAVRQFSAPKSVKDASADAAESSSEFSRAARNQPVLSTRQLNDDAPPKKPPRADRRDEKPSRRSAASDDDEEDGAYSRRGKKSSSRYDDEEDEAPRRGPGYDSTTRDDDAPRRRGKENDRLKGDDEDDEGGGWRGTKGSKSRASRDKEKADRDGDRAEGESREKSVAAARPAPPRQPLDLSDMRAFLTTALPKDAGVVQCYIRRNKSGTNKLFPVYSLFLKDGDRFLLASKKRPNNKTSNYLISMREGDLSRESESFLGKLRSNFMGTEFQIFDNGFNPKEERGAAGASVRRELGGIMYQANVLGNRGPRKMQVAIPAVDENSRPIYPAAGSEDVVQRIKDRNFRDLSYLINKPPRWNEQVNAYVLNFNGRVTMASVKNFQLVDPDEHNTVVLQFGRVGKDEFTMDMHYPISPLQAFAITMSSFDSKIACD